MASCSLERTRSARELSGPPAVIALAHEARARGARAGGSAGRDHRAAGAAGGRERVEDDSALRADRRRADRRGDSFVRLARVVAHALLALLHGLARALALAPGPNAHLPPRDG